MRIKNKIRLGSKKKIKLERVLKPYSEYWSEWIANKACFLTNREIIIVSYYKKYNSHKVASEELGITESRVSFIYIRALSRLKAESLYRRYYDWITDKMLSEAGMNQYKDQQDEFLNMPIHYHRFSSRMRGVLCSLGENLNEILRENSQKELLNYRNFGKKSLDDLKRRLKENNCAYLLK